MPPHSHNVCLPSWFLFRNENEDWLFWWLRVSGRIHGLELEEWESERNLVQYNCSNTALLRSPFERLGAEKLVGLGSLVKAGHVHRIRLNVPGTVYHPRLQVHPPQDSRLGIGQRCEEIPRQLLPAVARVDYSQGWASRNATIGQSHELMRFRNMLSSVLIKHNSTKCYFYGLLETFHHDITRRASALMTTTPASQASMPIHPDAGNNAMELVRVMIQPSA